MIVSKLKWLCIILLLVGVPAAYAQDGGTPPATPTPSPTVDPALPVTDPVWPPVPVYIMPVTTPAEDDLTLVGDLYLLDAARPTVLLLHQLYADRHSWVADVIPALLTAGYNALAVDVRGHGQTWGSVNWERAITDTQAWIDWMRANNLNAVVLMGSSMGSTLAITGCANDPFCLGAIAISPGWNYYQINLEAAFAEQLGTRPVLVVYAERDYWPAVGVPLMVEAATGPVEVLTFPGNAHGMDLFSTEDTLMPEIVTWLIGHAG